MSSTKQPQGIGGVFTSPDGDVIAEVAVFERPFGACTQREGQEYLAKRRLSYEVARQLCAPYYADALSEMARDSAMRMLINMGYKATYIPVRYEEE